MRTKKDEEQLQPENKAEAKLSLQKFVIALEKRVGVNTHSKLNYH